MSAIPGTNAPRKSFAQVAAEANVSKILSKEKDTNIPLTNLNGSTGTKLSNAALARLSNAPESVTDGMSSGQRSVNTPASVTSDVDQLNNLLQTVTFQDGHLQSLPPDHLNKREYDTKSVASRTTFTLDEKESLRPDDSASMQAAPEEDAFSPSGSVIAGSKGGSELEARAFRDQLHVLERAAPGKILTQRPVTGDGAAAELRANQINVLTPPAISPFTTSEASSFERPRTTNATPFLPPDEKLLEALASPKDRLFVLKIEQDMIDFVKDSKEEYLQLPQTNAFYRMLSHKLADYYMLGHLIDESMTSVRIFRTPHCRLPPPLIGPNSAADGGGTPPAIMTARKIMKRGGIGGDSLSAQLLAKDDADDGNNKKDLTREERENRYKEARARIFRDFKEEAPESADTSTKTSDKDVSRSSSANGVKKSKKKKPRDDEFEPRSAFTGVSPFPPPSTKSGSDGTFFNPFAPYALSVQLGGMAGHVDPNQQAQMQMQMQMQMQAQYAQQSSPGWSPQQPSQPYMMPAAAPGYSSQGYYDSNGVYNSISSPNMANQLTPRPAHQTLSSHMVSFNQQDDNAGWQQNYANQYPMQTGMVNPGFLDPNMMSNPVMYPMNPAYTQDPQAMAQAMAQQAAYGYPSHHARQQFNPKTQSFVPGVWGGPMQSMPSPSAYMPGSVMPQMQHNPSSMPPGFQPQQFNQPMNGSVRTNGQSSRSSPAPPRSSQPTSSGSSIAKWGTPSTLPAKPPSTLPATLPAKPPTPASFSAFATGQNTPGNLFSINGPMKNASGSAAKVGALR